MFIALRIFFILSVFRGDEKVYLLYLVLLIIIRMAVSGNPRIAAFNGY